MGQLNDGLRGSWVGHIMWPIHCQLCVAGNSIHEEFLGRMNADINHNVTMRLEWRKPVVIQDSDRVYNCVFCCVCVAVRVPEWPVTVRYWPGCFSPTCSCSLSTLADSLTAYKSVEPPNRYSLRQYTTLSHYVPLCTRLFCSSFDLKKKNSAYLSCQTAIESNVTYKNVKYHWGRLSCCKAVVRY